MKRFLAVLFVLAAVAPMAHAAFPDGDLGVGAELGSPLGLTAKYWVSDMFAIDGGMGYGNAAVFYADALFNSWRLGPILSSGKTNMYAGLGPRVASDDGGQFALRTIVGMGYWPNGEPIELFAQVGPTFKITPDNDVGIDGSVGIRYYFALSRATP